MAGVIFSSRTKKLLTCVTSMLTANLGAGEGAARPGDGGGGLQDARIGGSPDFVRHAPRRVPRKGKMFRGAGADARKFCCREPRQISWPEGGTRRRCEGGCGRRAQGTVGAARTADQPWVSRSVGDLGEKWMTLKWTKKTVKSI